MCSAGMARPNSRKHERSLVVAALTGSDSDLDRGVENYSDVEMDPNLDSFEGFRDRGDDHDGYTPFEFIEFTDLPLKHEVSMWVDRPISDVYKIWHNRLNWMQWFDMIEEVGFHEEEPTYISMYLWYQWGRYHLIRSYVETIIFGLEKSRFLL